MNHCNVCEQRKGFGINLVQIMAIDLACLSVWQRLRVFIENVSSTGCVALNHCP